MALSQAIINKLEYCLKNKLITIEQIKMEMYKNEMTKRGY